MSNISNNEASRIIDVIDSRIARHTNSMSKVETTWGEVAARDTGAKTVDVYLYGSAYASKGFRVIAGTPPLVGARVRVAIDKARGDRWVMEPLVGLDGTTTIGSGITGKENGSTVLSGAAAIDVRHGLDGVASGTDFQISVDETELSIPEASLSISDTVTGNVTSTAHGFAPKSPADATKFLNGAATPAYANVKDSDLATTDVTTNNVVSTKHGFAPKSPADATQFLNGAATPAYAQVKDSDLSTSDITTNNASTTKHGFVPKLPNDATKYYDGTGAFSVPAGGGGGGGSLTVQEADGSPSGTATTLVFPNDSVSISGGVATIRQVPTGTIGVGVHRTTAFNPGGTYTAVPFDAEDFDTDGFHDNVTNNTRLTVPAGLGGKYIVSGEADSGPANGYISIALNGAVTAYQSMSQSVATISRVMDLAAGDYVELKASTNGNTTFGAANAFSIVKLDSGKIGNGVGARATWTTAQAVNDSTYTAIDWTGTDEFDTDGFHDPATNSNRLTIPAGLSGKYLVSANLGWESNATGVRGVVINKNSSATGGGDQVWTSAANGIQTWQHISRVFDLVAGDYVSVSGYQTSGTAKNIVGGAFSIMRLDSNPSTTTVQDESGVVSAAVSKMVFPTGTVTINGDTAHLKSIPPTGFIGAKVYNNTTQSVTSGVQTKLNMNAEEYDTDGFHDNVTNNTRLTVPAGLSGKYHLRAFIYAGTASGTNNLRFYKNGSTVRGTNVYSNPGNGIEVTAILDLSSGDYVEVDYTPGFTGSTGHASAIEAQNTFSITKLDSGRVGLGVGVMVHNSTTQSNATGESAITFDTDDYDTDGFHDTSSNTSRFTIPTGMGGLYFLSGFVYSQGANVVHRRWRKNGSTFISGSSSTDANARGSDINVVVNLAAGDYVELMVNCSSTTTTGHASSLEAFNRASVMRLDSGSSGVLASDVVRLTSGDLTTASTSFVNATGLVSTVTTGARRCQVTFNGTVSNSSGSGGYVAIDIAVDGTRIGAAADYGLALAHGVSNDTPVSVTATTDILSAGSHTFQVMFRAAVAGTAKIFASTTGGIVATLSVQELPDSGAPAAGTGGALLGYTAYAPASDTAYSTSSGTLSDIDAANLAVTFTAPASGKVIVSVSGMFYGTSSAGPFYFAIREGSTQVSYLRYVTNLSSTGSNVVPAKVDFVITGLIPGSTHTYKWAWKVASGTANLGVGHASYGEAIMEVWDAAPSVPYVAGAGQLLGSLMNTTGGVYTVSSATVTDIDATNLAITFVAPASGAVLVRYTCQFAWSVSVSNWGFALREGSTTLAQYSNVTSSDGLLVSPAFKITGLTPGTTHTYKAAFYRNAGTGTLNVYASSTSPFVMELWSA